DCRFVKKLSLFLVSERGEFAKRMHDRPFVGGNGVGAEFEGGLQVLDGGLAGLRNERAGLKQHIRAHFFQPLTNVAARLARGPVAVKDGEGTQTIRNGAPAAAARGQTSEAPAHVIAAAYFSLLGDQQTQKRLADIAEANDRKIV